MHADIVMSKADHIYNYVLLERPVVALISGVYQLKSYFILFLYIHSHIKDIARPITVRQLHAVSFSGSVVQIQLTVTCNS